LQKEAFEVIQDWFDNISFCISPSKINCNMKKKLTYIAAGITLVSATTIILLSKICFGTLFKTLVIIFFIFAISTLGLALVSLLQGNRWLKKLAGLPVLGLFVLISFLAITLAQDNAAGYTRLTNAILKIIPANAKGAITGFPYQLTKAEWLQDILYFKKEFPLHHANPFLHVTKGEFDAAVDKLYARIEELTDNEIAFELCRVISMIKDGHTQLVSLPFNTPAFLNSRLFPLRIFFFNNGIYVTDGGRDNQELNGMRITMIGNTNIDDVVKKITPFVPGENDTYKKQWSFIYLLNAELLRYNGVIPNSEDAEFTFEGTDGKEIKKTISPVLSPVYLRWFRETIDLDDVSRKNQLAKNYWYNYNESTQTVFFQLNQVNDEQNGVSIKLFAQQLNDFVNQHKVSKFIIDTRNCNGGDNTRMMPLVTFIAGNKKINQYGSLYVLTGRQTFSAGISFVSALESNTNLIFVGEPSGSGPNQCGDVQTFMLPNSKLVMQVSSKYHLQGFYKDMRLQIDPSLPVTYTYNEWKQNIDPAMAVINASTKPALLLPAIIDTLTFSKFEGRYSFDADKILVIKNDSGKLVFEVDGYTSFATGVLHAVQPNDFIANNGLVTMNFTGAQNGKFDQLILKWAGATDTLKRLPAGFLSAAEFLKMDKVSDAIELYRQAKIKGVVFAASTEMMLNLYGYNKVAENKLDDALLLFTLNTELFPFSGNTWDSLAETWLKKGDKEKAKLYYAKSLEMNPENNGARQALSNL